MIMLYTVSRMHITTDSVKRSPKNDAKALKVAKRYRDLRDSGADPRGWAYAWRRELNRGGFRAVDFLMDEIVDSKKCVGCASCVTICPVDVSTTWTNALRTAALTPASCA